MSLKSRTEKNLEFLDSKIERLEREVLALKKVRLKMIGLLHSDDRYLKRKAEEIGLRVAIVKLRRGYRDGSNKS